MTTLKDLALAGFRAQTGFKKEAGLLGVAKGLASTAKGVGSVAKNLVKQNPTVAKAAAGGVLAGVAATKMTQTKQAEEKKPYGAVRHARDAVMTTVDAYAGKAFGGLAALGTNKHAVGSSAFHQRVGFGKGLGMAAGATMGVANAIGRREDHYKKASEIKDRGLAKEEKDDAGGGKFNASPGAAAGVGKSSLIAAAKAEMAKSA